MRRQHADEAGHRLEGYDGAPGAATAQRDYGDILGDLFRAQPASTYSAPYAGREGSPIPRGITPPFPIASLAPSPPPKPRSAAQDYHDGYGNGGFGAPAPVMSAQFAPAAVPAPSSGGGAAPGGASYTSQAPRVGFPVGRDGPIVGMPLQFQSAPDAVPRAHVPQPAPPDRPQQRNLPVAPLLAQGQASASRSVASVPAEEEHERSSELAVLDGYNPNTWDPPLRFGDTIALLIEGYNGMVAYGGSADGKAWIQFLRVRAPPYVFMYPWSDACARAYVHSSVS